MIVNSEIPKTIPCLFPEQISLNKCLVEKMQSVITRFQKQQGLWISSNCQLIKDNNVCYYGIHKSMQFQENSIKTRQIYKELKNRILECMDFPSNSTIIQVIGDTALFSLDATKKMKSILTDCLTPENIVLYGYTGHANPDGRRCVNSAISDVITEKMMQDHVIANLVGFHTQIAISRWHCTGPLLKHYIIVYSDDESSSLKGTVFGDDIIASDFFADQLILFDGGIQSFRQVSHALLLNQKITIISGLRENLRASKTEMIEEKPSVITPYFNTATFLQEIENFVTKDGFDEIQLNNWYAQYFGLGKCYICDPLSVNYDKKLMLMNDAWKYFLDHKLHTKIKKLVFFCDS